MLVVRRSITICFAALAGILTTLGTDGAFANPAFARQYSVSCAMCHAAFPKLNSFGQAFLADNIRMADWKEKVGVPTGDEMLVLPKFPQLAFRAQGFAQVRQNDTRDDAGKQTANANYDFQTPYLIKLLAGAPLSENTSYYFSAIVSEKGQNGTLLLDDAWITYTDMFGSGVGATLGQWQIADLMFSRETRLTVQDFIPYRMAALTYERGLLLDRDIGPVGVTVGISNGNGTSNSNLRLNSAGIQRPDRSFDNNSRKNVLAHAGFDVGPANVGLLAVGGDHANKNGDMVSKRVYGLNVSTSKNDEIFAFAQLIWNRWDDFIVAGKTYAWTGGFAGVDYVRDSHWVFSALYNYADAGDLDNDPVYNGLNLNSVTGTVSYYFMRNLKGVVEANVDLLDTGDAHYTKENYLLVGFDTAF